MNPSLSPIISAYSNLIIVFFFNNYWWKLKFRTFEGFSKIPPDADFDTWIPDMSGKIRTYGNPRRNVPGTRRKVALHDESFDGTQQNSLVRICLVMMRDVWLSMMQSLYRGFTAWNTLEWPQSLRKPWEIYGPTLFTAKKRHLIEKSEEPWRHHGRIYSGPTPPYTRQWARA